LPSERLKNKEKRNGKSGERGDFQDVTGYHNKGGRKVQVGLRGGRGELVSFRRKVWEERTWTSRGKNFPSEGHQGKGGHPIKGDP